MSDVPLAAELLAAGGPVVRAGDYNVVPSEADIWQGHHAQANGLLQPQPRAAFQRQLDAGWTDGSRALQPDRPPWTLCGYLRHRWPNSSLRQVFLHDLMARRAVRSARQRTHHPPCFSSPGGSMRVVRL